LGKKGVGFKGSDLKRRPKSQTTPPFGKGRRRRGTSGRLASANRRLDGVKKGTRTIYLKEKKQWTRAKIRKKRRAWWRG